MNEVLTRLYRESRPKEALASQDEFKSANALLGSDVEKFAKLIVQECVQVSGPEDSYTDEWFKAKADSVAKIKQHFGVEE